MINAIQEEEIRLTNLYCKDYKEELLDLLIKKTSEYNSTVNVVKIKIDKEKKDISILYEKLEICRENIEFNQARINEIPKLIEELKRDIEYCESEIASTPVPVYDYYEDEDGNTHSEIDYAATAANEAYIAEMKQRIKDDEEEIAALEEEMDRRRGYIDALEKMISEINGVINLKQTLITELESELKELEDVLRRFKNTINDSTAALDKLSSNLLLAAQYINSFGNAVAKTRYKNMENGYYSTTTFVASSKMIDQEITYLKDFASNNESLLKQIKGFTATFTGILQSESTDVATNEIIDSIKTQDECYDYVEFNIKTLRHANEYLVRYEQIKF